MTRRIATGVLIFLGLASIALACWSLADGGIGWDSRGDTDSALITRAVSTSSTLQEAYDQVPVTSELYGVLPQQVADVLHLLTTGSTTPLSPNSPTTYLYQGAGNLLFAVLAITAFGFAIGTAFRSLLVGAFAWSLILSMPLWLGMSHVDFKDGPVASGLTLVSAGLILAFVLEPRCRAALVGGLLGAFGGGIAIATRPSAIVLLCGLAGGTLFAAFLWGVRRRRMRAALPVVVTAAVAPVAGLALTWATNPIARIGTTTWLHDSIEIARKYPWDRGPIRVAGRDVRAIHLPWWYVPAWVWAQLPLLTLAALVCSVVAIAFVLIRRRRGLNMRLAWPLIPVVLQALVLPFFVVASHAVIYDGIRHELFMFPALLALPAIALALLDRDAGRRLRVALPIAAVVVVSASFAASARWAPYAYAFVNPIAGRNKVNRAYELDYWGVSAREGVTRLKKLGYDPVYTVPGTQPGIPWGGSFLQPVTGGKAAIYVFVRWDRASNYGCDVIFTIKRDGNLLGEGAKCPKPSGAG